MTIRVTIEVPDAKIGRLLAQLDGYKALCEHVPVEKPEKVDKRSQPRRNGDAVLTMTGKKPTRSEYLEKGLSIFEKLEKRKGIGTVRVKDFKDELKKKQLRRGMFTRLIAEKYLDYL